jgi:hypothetical protein
MRFVDRVVGGTCDDASAGRWPQLQPSVRSRFTLTNQDHGATSPPRRRGITKSQEANVSDDDAFPIIICMFAIEDDSRS